MPKKYTEYDMEHVKFAKGGSMMVPLRRRTGIETTVRSTGGTSHRGTMAWRELAPPSQQIDGQPLAAVLFWAFFCLAIVGAALWAVFA